MSAAVDNTPVVLEAQGLVMRFGGITATNDVSLQLRRGARHALIGPNGAGKTTLVNLLTGVLAPTAGRIALLGEDVTRLPPHQRPQFRPPQQRHPPRHHRQQWRQSSRPLLKRRVRCSHRTAQTAPPPAFEWC